MLGSRAVQNEATTSEASGLSGLWSSVQTGAPGVSSREMLRYVR